MSGISKSDHNTPSEFRPFLEHESFVKGENLGWFSHHSIFLTVTLLELFAEIDGFGVC